MPPHHPHPLPPGKGKAKAPVGSIETKRPHRPTINQVSDEVIGLLSMSTIKFIALETLYIHGCASYLALVD